MERLAGRYRIIAPDLYGCGKSPAWPGERPMWIDDQIELLASAFERAGERFHLVGHSYGGAIALKAALGLRPRLASLVLYEPVLFAVLLRAAPQSDPAREIAAVRDDVLAGAPAAAAERFIDYWMGKGAWAATPDSRRAALVDAVQAQMPEWHSACNEPTPLEKIREVSDSKKHQAAARVLASVEEGAQQARAAVTRPLIGAGITGAAVLGIGSMLGVTQAVLAGAAVWLVFRALRRRARPA